MGAICDKICPRRELPDLEDVVVKSMNRALEETVVSKMDDRLDDMESRVDDVSEKVTDAWSQCQEMMKKLANYPNIMKENIDSSISGMTDKIDGSVGRAVDKGMDRVVGSMEGILTKKLGDNKVLGKIF